jgi:hypothetical protein
VGYVPYTGATTTLNLGSQNFITTGTLGAGAITGTSVSLNDTNTQITEDGSGNLTFKDAVAGTTTLTALKSMRNVWISDTCTYDVGDDQYTLSDATNWACQYSYIDYITVKTDNTSWECYLYETSAFNDALISTLHLVSGRSGNFIIPVHRCYNSDGNNVYIRFVDNNGDGYDYEVYITGEARRH